MIDSATCARHRPGSDLNQSHRACAAVGTLYCVIQRRRAVSAGSASAFASISAGSISSAATGDVERIRRRRGGHVLLLSAEGVYTTTRSRFVAGRSSSPTVIARACPVPSHLRRLKKKKKIVREGATKDVRERVVVHHRGVTRTKKSRHQI